MSEKNPFKKLDGESEVPEELKDQVMGSINRAQLMAGLADLFTFKAGRTIQELADQLDPDSSSSSDD